MKKWILTRYNKRIFESLELEQLTSFLGIPFIEIGEGTAIGDLGVRDFWGDDIFWIEKDNLS
jgi:hypothetical protein